MKIAQVTCGSRTLVRKRTFWYSPPPNKNILDFIGAEGTGLRLLVRRCVRRESHFSCLTQQVGRCIFHGFQGGHVLHSPQSGGQFSIGAHVHQTSNPKPSDSGTSAAAFWGKILRVQALSPQTYFPRSGFPWLACIVLASELSLPVVWCPLCPPLCE